MSKTVYVYDGRIQDKKVLIGKLFVDTDKNTETYSFEYENAWLNSKSAIQLDPNLFLYSGRQFSQTDKHLFGVFSDSCPDRWGRLLLQRREAILARNENRKPRKLEESDYLLGVFDETRMGALRFSCDEGKTFESCDESFATPPFVSIRNLEVASLQFEKDNLSLEEKWLNQLLAPGSSLGGSRPKATVKDSEGNLWIAKFPSKHDTFDSGAWEMVAHDLAKLCNLNVPEAKLEQYSFNGSTFIVKRFDRDKSNRIYFASAMTLLGKTDGCNDSSYLDIASFIKSNGKKPKEDLIELWKRIVFSMAISNTDDHLRNHGFLLKDNGWELSPLYDVNPIPYGNNLSLNVNEFDSTIDLDLAIETAPVYGLETSEAITISSSILKTVKNNWEKLAKRNGLSKSSIEFMRPAFRLTEN